ncbi:unnamed protein product [Blepharisma stoltei]|uniref:C2 NT-type domain-containing protein n=1 Tax=Blepharisma stoltei TaxID=1481888 RepID=A0AAU9JJM8_9CILI|nr:unnamed protein product [Blepharisma stoltei]
MYQKDSKFMPKIVEFVVLKVTGKKPSKIGKGELEFSKVAQNGEAMVNQVVQIKGSEDKQASLLVSIDLTLVRKQTAQSFSVGDMKLNDLDSDFLVYGSPKAQKRKLIRSTISGGQKDDDYNRREAIYSAPLSLSQIITEIKEENEEAEEKTEPIQGKKGKSEEIQEIRKQEKNEEKIEEKKAEKKEERKVEEKEQIKEEIKEETKEENKEVKSEEKREEKKEEKKEEITEEKKDQKLKEKNEEKYKEKSEEKYKEKSEEKKEDKIEELIKEEKAPKSNKRKEARKEDREMDERNENKIEEKKVERKNKEKKAKEEEKKNMEMQEKKEAINGERKGAKNEEKKEVNNENFPIEVKEAEKKDIRNANQEIPQEIEGTISNQNDKIDLFVSEDAKFNENETFEENEELNYSIDDIMNEVDEDYDYRKIDISSFSNSPFKEILLGPMDYKHDPKFELIESADKENKHSPALKGNAKDMELKPQKGKLRGFSDDYCDKDSESESSSSEEEPVFVNNEIIAQIPSKTMNEVPPNQQSKKELIKAKESESMVNGRRGYCVKCIVF